MTRSLLQGIGLIGIALLFAEILYIETLEAPLTYDRVATTTPMASTSDPIPLPVAKAVDTPLKKAAAKPKPTQPAAATTLAKPEDSNLVHRTENPYSSAPKSTDALNEEARGALVNIYCQTTGGPLGSISGSGVMIDPRGVILTNAHVAQYVLLATDKRVGLTCGIRTGGPAQLRWKASILYMPSAWVSIHAADINTSHPKGTGEHDYALLFITGSLDSTPLPSAFPFIAPDTREAIGFTSDSVLLAGYPAEFAGNTTRGSLYPSTVFTRIGDLLTFGENSVDLLSLGNVVLAQSGSSGGSVVNLWGRLVGLISTTSEGTTTGDRELRAITLSYISRSLQTATGANLETLLASDVATKAANFMANEAPALASQLVEQLP